MNVWKAKMTDRRIHAEIIVHTCRSRKLSTPSFFLNVVVVVDNFDFVYFSI